MEDPPPRRLQRRNLSETDGIAAILFKSKRFARTSSKTCFRKGLRKRHAMNDDADDDADVMLKMRLSPDTSSKKWRC